MSNIYQPCPCGSGKKLKFCCLAILKNPETLLPRAAEFPVEQCFGVNQEGMANVIVARRLPTNAYLIGMFLVDQWCLGVKDAHFFANAPASKIDFLRSYLENRGGGANIMMYEAARSLILGGLEFAKNHGFEPHSDWHKTKFIVEPQRPFERMFEFGLDGKPFYVQGPYDSPTLLARVAAGANAG